MPPTGCAWCGRCRTVHDDVIDLVLFLNGIPVATVEIKTDFTQDINAAVDQYRFDRIPRPRASPLPSPCWTSRVGRWCTSP
jgi:type I restriction enzyme R subunit